MAPAFSSEEELSRFRKDYEELQRSNGLYMQRSKVQDEVISELRKRNSEEKRERERAEKEVERIYDGIAKFMNINRDEETEDPVTIFLHALGDARTKKIQAEKACIAAQERKHRALAEVDDLKHQLREAHEQHEADQDDLAAWQTEHGECAELQTMNLEMNDTLTTLHQSIEGLNYTVFNLEQQITTYKTRNEELEHALQEARDAPSQGTLDIQLHGQGEDDDALLECIDPLLLEGATPAQDSRISGLGAAVDAASTEHQGTQTDDMALSTSAVLSIDAAPVGGAPPPTIMLTQYLVKEVRISGPVREVVREVCGPGPTQHVRRNDSVGYQSAWRLLSNLFSLLFFLLMALVLAPANEHGFDGGPATLLFGSSGHWVLRQWLSAALLT